VKGDLVLYIYYDDHAVLELIPTKSRIIVLSAAVVMINEPENAAYGAEGAGEGAGAGAGAGTGAGAGAMANLSFVEAPTLLFQLAVAPS